MRDFPKHLAEWPLFTWHDAVSLQHSWLRRGSSAIRGHARMQVVVLNCLPQSAHALWCVLGSMMRELSENARMLSSVSKSRTEMRLLAMQRLKGAKFANVSTYTAGPSAGAHASDPACAGCGPSNARTAQHAYLPLTLCRPDLHCSADSPLLDLVEAAVQPTGNAQTMIL